MDHGLVSLSLDLDGESGIRFGEVTQGKAEDEDVVYLEERGMSRAGAHGPSLLSGCYLLK